ncbi:endonuclease domain-containing protein [Sphingomonas sp. VDB2]|uniref:endonuclease domain-containing protein n=1 Tax=Sphingomonas sp. VDB2 TaxID=3228751 RepID=UPI003A810833
MRQLSTMQDRARKMRHDPTEPEKRLWRVLSGSKLGGYKFRRQAVAGYAVADFLCPQKAVIVEIDGDTHADGSDSERDHRLSEQGYHVIRFGNADVMTNLEGVCERLLAVLETAPDRWHNPHPNPSPEGEGLFEINEKTSD